VRETTAVGAAFLAGIGAGVWSSPDDVARAWHEEASFVPRHLADSDRRRARWRAGVERARGWATGQ
jgi:glycerol kinase